MTNFAYGIVFIDDKIQSVYTLKIIFFLATETEDQTDSVWKSEREVWEVYEKGNKEVSGAGGHFSGGHWRWGRDEESSGSSGMGIHPSAIPEAGVGCRLQG